MDTQAGAEAQKVFICYRRQETAAHAGRLYDAMVARFGESNVFMDVDIAPGVDFVERITEVVSRCLVLIVVMGPSWATVTDEDGGPRIEDPDDFVRLEVETALRRRDVTPIPALVAGARMPRREALPEALQPLTRRNALELSDARWAYDVGRLNSTLDVLLGETGADRDTGAEPYPTPMPLSPPTPVPESRPTPAAAPAATPQPTAAPRPAPPSPSQNLNRRLVLEGMLVAGVAAVVGRFLAGNPHQPSEEELRQQITQIVVKRGVTWGLVGAALAVWLAIRMKRANLFGNGVIGLLVGAAAGAIGGGIWAARVFVPEPDLGVESPAANAIQILALAITCGIVGMLIGWLWRPPRPGIGLVTGAAGVALLQILINTLGWNTTHQPGNALNYGLAAIVATGAVLATLQALDRQRAEDTAPVGVSAAEP